MRQAVLEALGVPEGLLPLLASLVGNDFVEQAHRSPTRTGPCTLNAVPAPAVYTWRREGPAWPLPHHLVRVEKFTLPSLTFPPPPHPQARL